MSQSAWIGIIASIVRLAISMLTVIKKNFILLDYGRRHKNRSK